MKTKCKDIKLLPLSRALVVVKRCLCYPEGVSFSMIKESLQPIAPGVVSRLLKAMLAEGLLVKTEKGLYQCGSLIDEIVSLRKPQKNPDFLISAYVSALASDSGLSAAYFELSENGLFLKAKSEVNDGFHYIDLYRTMGNIPNHTFSQIAIVFGGEKVRKILKVSPEILKSKELKQRFSEIRKGKIEFFDLGQKRIFRIGRPVMNGNKLCGVVGLTSYEKTEDENKLNKINLLIKNTAKKIGEIYESNNGNV